MQSINPTLSGFSSLPAALAALAAVLALVWLFQWVARSGVWRRLMPRGTANPARRLAIADALALDPRRRLHLIRCDSQEVLILTGGPQDVLLGWLPMKEPAP
jgi:flagellar protein FliO/FliZ